MTDLSADLGSHPVRIVPPAELGGNCASCPDGDLPVAAAAIVTVNGYDTQGRAHHNVVCALHLSAVVRDHTRRGRSVVVEAPTCSPRWFTRTDRETWYAVDEYHGVVVARDVLDTWTVWLHRENGEPRPLYPRVGLRDGESAAQCRVRVEDWAQDHAARLAADAYEAEHAVAEVAELRPVHVLGGVA